MNTRTFFALIAIGLVSFLTGCATTQEPLVAGINAPRSFKDKDATITYGKYKELYFKELIAKAEAGDVDSQYEIAFVTGLNDINTSNYWMEKAAAQNYLPAIATLGMRHYDYSKFRYSKDDVLAERLCLKAYDIYQSKPASEWSIHEAVKTSQALVHIAQYNLSDKDKAQEMLCKAQKITTAGDTPYVVNHYLQKIGRTCK